MSLPAKFTGGSLDGQMMIQGVVSRYYIQPLFEGHTIVGRETYGRARVERDPFSREVTALCYELEQSERAKP